MMEKQNLKDEFFGWLDITFNDLYSFYDSRRDQIILIRHCATTLNKRMWEVLKSYAADAFVENFKGAFYIDSENNFRVVFYAANDEQVSIVIEPLDDKIINTNLLKGE